MNAETIRVPRRDDYFPIVRGLKPLCNGEELMLRASLLLMRDRAMATKSQACEPAWLILDVVQREAGDNALNFDAPLDGLRELRRLCLSCIMTASGFDMLYRPRPMAVDKGRADEGG